MKILKSAMGGIALVLIVAGTTGAISRNDRQRLQGSWIAVAAERDGRAANDLLGHRLVVDGDSFAIHEQGQMIYQGTVAIDPAPEPHAIDFKHGPGILNGKIWRGIYKFKGDTLSICDNASNLSRPRPAQFDTRLGSGFVSLIFKQMKE